LKNRSTLDQILSYLNGNIALKIILPIALIIILHDSLYHFWTYFYSNDSANLKVSLLIWAGLFPFITVVVKYFEKNFIETLKPLVKVSEQLHSEANKQKQLDKFLSGAENMQKSSINHLFGLSNSLSADTKESSESLGTAMGYVADIQRIIRKSPHELKELEKSIKGISDQIVRVNDVESVFYHIASEIETINEIVFKTQLLSFNASIQAAKAGIHGSGFSVVANDIAELANTSGKVSKNISEQLMYSQQEMRELAKDLRRVFDHHSQSTVNAIDNFQELINLQKVLTKQIKDTMDILQPQNQHLEKLNLELRHASELHYELDQVRKSGHRQSEGLVKVNGDQAAITANLIKLNNRGKKCSQGFLRKMIRFLYTEVFLQMQEYEKSIPSYSFPREPNHLIESAQVSRAITNLYEKIETTSIPVTTSSNDLRFDPIHVETIAERIAQLITRTPTREINDQNKGLLLDHWLKDRSSRKIYISSGDLYDLIHHIDRCWEVQNQFYRNDKTKAIFHKSFDMTSTTA